MHLLMGDIFLEKSFEWHLGDLDIETQDKPFAPPPLNALETRLQPEIAHTFKEAII